MINLHWRLVTHISISLSFVFVFIIEFVGKMPDVTFNTIFKLAVVGLGIIHWMFFLDENPKDKALEKMQRDILNDVDEGTFKQYR